MNAIPETLPISELRFHQSEVLDQLSNGPVLLTRQGKAAAVLVDPVEWNRIVEQIEDLQLALDAVETRLAAEPVIDFDDYLVRRGERGSATTKQ
jgi:prevent-host-death family protein